MNFTFGTLCSGIESASQAFLPLGAECAYVAEIEPFPCAVLADRHGASKPRRMPSPDDVVFPDGYDKADAALFKALSEVSPRSAGAKTFAEDDAFVKAWRSRADRRAAIKTVEGFQRWGDRIPNLGDLTQIDPEELPAVDLLVAGFPCQDYSIAGLRQSLAGARGNLSLYGVKLIHELVRLRRIRSVLLEQVPDVLNTKDNAWGAIVGGIVGHDAPIVSPYHGGRWTNAGVADGPLGTAAWRVLDAQYAGVAQRRERVFLVASFGDGPDPVEVLFERQGVSRNPPARRQAGEGAAGAADERASCRSDDRSQRRAAFGGNNTAGPIDVATARTASHTASGRQDFDTETFVVEAPDIAHPVLAKHNASHRDDSDTYIVQPIAFNARQDPIYGPVVGPVDTDGGTHAIAFSCKDHGADAGDVAPTLRAMGHGATHPNAGGQVAVAFSLRGRIGGAMPEVEAGYVSPGLRAADGGSTRPFVACVTGEVTHTLTAHGHDASEDGTGRGPPLVGDAMAVRRITVVEANRLQGFPDFHTLIEWPTANRKGEELAEQIDYLVGHGFDPERAAVLAQTPDGPQYKGIGNSKAVPLVRKIGERYTAALDRYLAARAS